MWHIQINEQNFIGWSDLSISISVEQLAPALTLSVIHPVAKNIALGSSISASYNNQVLYVGWIDSIERTLNSNGNTINLIAQPISIDLIECTHQLQQSDYSNTSILTVAQDLCKAHGINVKQEGTTLASTTKLDSLNIKPTDKSFTVLQNEIKKTGLLMRIQAKDLILSKAGSGGIVAKLEEGVNILSGSSSSTIKNRYAKIAVSSLAASWQEENAELQINTATDNEIRSNRYLRIDQNSNQSSPQSNKQAKFEVERRKKTSVTYKISVHDFEHSQGLWQVGDYIEVQSPSLNMSGTYELVSCVFNISEKGKLSELILREVS